MEVRASTRRCQSGSAARSKYCLYRGPGASGHPKWRRGDEGFQQRELRIEVWRGDEWLVGEHERMHVKAAKTFLGSASRT